MKNESMVMYAQCRVLIPNDDILQDDIQDDVTWDSHSFTIENVINHYYPRLHRRKKNMIHRGKYKDIFSVGTIEAF